MQILRIKEVTEKYREMYENSKILSNFWWKSDRISSFKRHF